MRKKERGIIALLLLKTAVAQNMTDGFELNPRVTNQYGMGDEGTSIFLSDQLLAYFISVACLRENRDCVNRWQYACQYFVRKIFVIEKKTKKATMKRWQKQLNG